MEKYRFYEMAVTVTEAVLEYSENEVAIRALFRLCRKTDDYTRADQYLQTHPQIRQRKGF